MRKRDAQRTSHVANAAAFRISINQRLDPSLLRVNMIKASFRAPDVSEPKLFRFSLRVTDRKEADSLPDYLDIIVEP